jgi:hypothetical protein
VPLRNLALCLGIKAAVCDLEVVVLQLALLQATADCPEIFAHVRIAVSLLDRSTTHHTVVMVQVQLAQ